MGPDTDRLPAATRIGRTALQVDDLGEMTAFYRDVVGLEPLSESSSRAVLGVADAPLLVLDAAAEVSPRPPQSAGLFHTAFRVPSRAALGDALARIQDRWQLDGASDHRVSEALYLADPEDNGVEVYRDFPRSEWPHTDDGRVEMGTDPLDLDAVARAAGGASGLPDGTDVGHVHLEVSSLDAFAEFYVDAVGFERQTTMRDARFVSAGGYHHHLGANTWHRRSEPASGTGLAWFEVVLPDADAFDALRDRLEASQYGSTTVDGAVAVTGPDGIEVRFRAES
ncbi:MULTISPECIES: VOC family protein [Halolamina]|uniref:Catechol 2,3-dioxygenase n=1 Tax=Halolamina pelagica TaxID=699431 RepID=A0A1I5PRK0_9EURY|nr:MULTISPECIES: VOC family protein [Halolamina]NHX34909.1 VOC family protein [Halolamina sp. R1-12]SFP36141.1 catechol 2,3-dioxygenase [Halolamina pelagica]